MACAICIMNAAQICLKPFKLVARFSVLSNQMKMITFAYIKN